MCGVGTRFKFRIQIICSSLSRICEQNLWNATIFRKSFQRFWQVNALGSGNLTIRLLYTFRMFDCVDLIKLPLWIYLRASNINFGRIASQKMLLILQTLQLLLKLLGISLPCLYNCSSLGKLASKQPPASKSAELTLLKEIEVDGYFP